MDPVSGHRFIDEVDATGPRRKNEKRPIPKWQFAEKAGKAERRDLLIITVQA
jgi:hypothetical protein